jgi:thiol-disulfide isomerase/thioredoxin
MTTIHPSISEQKRNPASRMTRRYMSSTTSQTGSRLIESVEEYATTIRNMNHHRQEDDHHQQQQEQQPVVERPILLFWTAPWCGPCRLTVPIVKAIRKRYIHDIDTIEICTDDLPDLASAVGVTSVPTIHLYYQGKERM